MNSLLGNPTYNNALRLRAAALVLMLALIVLVCMKLYNSYRKVDDYRKAEQQFIERNWVQAELYVNKAALNRWLSYKSGETAIMQDALKPVTDMRDMLRSIVQRTEEARNNEDLPGLLAAYGEYGQHKLEAAGREGDYPQQFAEVSALERVEDSLTGALRDVEERANKQLQANMKKNAFSDDAAAALLQLPAGYFGGDQARLDRLRAVLAPYDQARIQALQADASKGVAELLAEGVRLSGLYGQYGGSPDWLYPLIEQTAQARLLQARDKNDWAAFWLGAVQYEAAKDWPQAGSPVSQTIQDSFNGQLAAARQLTANQQYPEAIAMYASLAAYRDMSGSVRDTELAWALAQPEQMLQKVAPGAVFNQVISGKGQFGSLAYAAGIADNKLVLARLMSDMSIDKKEATLGQGINVKELRAVDSLGLQGMQTLMVQAASSSRKSRYIGYDALQGGLQKLLDVEADGYQLERQGLLVVANDNASGAGQQAYYEYRNGEYRFSRIKPDYVDIALADLPKYRNVKVRFQCTIIAADDDVSVAMLDNQYILLSGVKLRTGAATITGTWTAYEEIKKGAQSIPAIKVNVSNAQQ
ncbi:MAG: hypothetical protein K0Q59_4834 [Paenibacillus sp.]|jgi:hypothetical protein|nr:hypothetical protein [Paenibacillus sp.]